jgi:hypothetical protein
MANFDSKQMLQVFGDATKIREVDLAFGTLPGITGHLVAVIMVLMYASAVKYVRSAMFHVFWYAHHLFILYYVLLSIHGNFANN